VVAGALVVVTVEKAVALVGAVTVEIASTVAVIVVVVVYVVVEEALVVVVVFK